MLRSFSFSDGDLDVVLMFKIYNAMEASRWYFYKVCGSATDEAMHLTLLHALTHYKEANGDLGAYVRSLARTILRDRYANTVTSVDFLEETVTLDGVQSDVASQVVDKLNQEECYERVVGLSLTCMNYFVLMCDALERKDTSTLYFPDYFTSDCLKLQQEFGNFYRVCSGLYSKYKDSYLSFMLEEDTSWVEANYTLVKSRVASRVSLLSSTTGLVSKDPDKEDCTVCGSINNKRIISIPYRHQLDTMCDLIDEDCGINAIRFSIGDTYVIKTLGGSLSVLNPSLFYEYELCETEILTNLIKDTNGRFICKGSERMYFLVPEIPVLKQRTVRGINLSFSLRVEI